MPWKDTSVENVRYRFILSLKNHRGSFQEICDAFGISRKTGYKWLGRFSRDGKSGLTDQRRIPKNRPRDTPAEIEAAIVGAKCRYPFFGAKKLRVILQREHPDLSWPSTTTFSNILKRNGFTTTRRCRARLAQTAPLQDCKSPNDVWSADFKGWWKTKDKDTCEPLTVCDGCTRFLLCCRHVKRRSLDYVWNHLQETFEEYGMPLRFRTDNGPPFASTSLGRLSRLSVRLIRLGITPEWITPGKPQENGRHERMHRTLKLEAASPPANTLEQQEESLRGWMNKYNFVRPHEALDMATPGEIYVPSTRLWTGEEQDPAYPDQFELRRVDKIGVVKWKGQRIFTSELLKYQILGFHNKEQGVAEVYFGAILLGTVDRGVGFKRV